MTGNRTRRARWAGIGAGLVLGAGCAHQVDPTLAQARAAYTGAQQNIAIAQNAPVALAAAGQTLRQAERADSAEETRHLAYIAERQVELATQEARQRQAEQQARQALSRRELDQLRDKLAELKAQETERGLMLTLGDVLFASDRAELAPGAEQGLMRLAEFLRAHPAIAVRIEGFTDSRGTASYNAELSERRARAVAEFLVRSGIDPERISARGYGDAYPVASNSTQAGRLQNRRVEIYLSQPGQRPGGRASEG